MSVRDRSPAPTRPTRAGSWLPAASVAAALAVGTGVALALLAASGSLAPVTLPGLPTVPRTVLWALPLSRVVSDLAAVATTGCLFAAALLVPGHRGMSIAGYRWTRLAVWPAAVWCAAALVAVPLQLADFLGAGGGGVTVRGLASFVTTIPQGRAQLTVLVLVAVVAVGARTVVTTGGSLTLLLTALLATLPPLLTGHAAGVGSHQAAVSGLVLHVLAVVGWAGGLTALVLLRGLPGPVLLLAVTRFSRVAPLLVGLVALSGLVVAATRVSTPGQLVGTAYGLQVVVKTSALAALALVGWWHRRRTLPALAAGDRSAFWRIAAGEVVGMAATIGTAVSLSRTPTPRGDEGPVADGDGVAELLGFALPPDPGSGRWSTQFWLPYPDILFPVLAVLAVGGWLVAVRVVERDGVRWPASRTAAWVLGWAAVLAATSSGLARYAFVSMTARTVQLLVLALVVPVLLARAAPTTLADQVATAVHRRRDRRGDDAAEALVDDVRGAVGWWSALRGSRVVAAVSRPGPAVLLFALVVYGGQVAPVLELTLRSHTRHTW